MQPVAMRSDDEKLQEQIRRLAQEVLSEISELDSSRSKELLGTFVSELFLSVAEQERRQMRRQKQAEGIAAARERGVRFGRQHLPVPDGFEDLARQWENGGISAGSAAAKLGMSRDTFLRRAREYRTAI